MSAAPWTGRCRDHTGAVGMAREVCGKGKGEPGRGWRRSYRVLPAEAGRGSAVRVDLMAATRCTRAEALASDVVAELRPRQTGRVTPAARRGAAGRMAIRNKEPPVADTALLRVRTYVAHWSLQLRTCSMPARAAIVRPAEKPVVPTS